MSDFSRRLPPLDHLVAFEAAARLLSFTRAADEIAVTQSAISQRIRLLETALGSTLFIRGHRSVRLTREGREFQNSVTIALSHILSGAEGLRAPVRPARLSVATDEAVGALWLGQRLHRFHERHPDIAINLTVSDLPDRAFAPDVDLAIVHGAGAWPGYQVERLFEERIFAVCAPGLIGLEGPMDLSGLTRAALLDFDYERWNWMNWTIWLTELGAPVSVLNRQLQCNSYALVVEAARCGQGVALGWQHFVDQDLISGALVMAHPAVVKTDLAYFIAFRSGGENPATSLFTDWLLEERDSQPLFHGSRVC